VTDHVSEDAWIESTVEFDEFQQAALDRGWGDGLPLVPPTRDRVEAMLGAYLERADESIGAVAPLWNQATYLSVAANAVMAGCAPAHFPVVAAAVEAVTQPQLNLYGIQGTTSPVTTAVIVNGPIRAKAGVHSGQGAMGPGWRANATIGRALRLVTWNIGGGRPTVLGVSLGKPGMDMATQGFPGKYGFCAGENEEESPWEPLHVERGFAPEDSAVTVLCPDSSGDFRDVASQNSEETLICVAETMKSWGTANMLYGSEPAWVFSPEQAKLLANEGWSKKDIKRYLFEHARLDLTTLPRSSQRYVRVRRPDHFDLSDMPVCNAPEDFTILVIGGQGIHGVNLSTFSGARSVTVRVLEGPVLP
jgi:hypothetical protein